MRGWAMRQGVAGTLAIVAALLLPLTAGAAAKSEVQPPEEEVQVLLDHLLPDRGKSEEGTHVLILRIYPLRGIAVVTAATNDYEVENREAVSYVEQIPKAPFDGRIDLKFAGLGSFSGDVAPGEVSRDQRPRGCAGRAGEQSLGSFSGTIYFSGPGNWAGWHATRAKAFVQRSFELHCRHGAAERVPVPKTLTDYVLPGAGSFSGWRFGLYATQRRPHRFTELEVFDYEGRHGRAHGINFDATTFELLAGGITASRTVDRSVPIDGQLVVTEGSHHPKHAVLRPQAPFSGTGVYSRSTHRLTGSLAVEFPGLHLRLAGADTAAELFDEAHLPGEPVRTSDAQLAQKVSLSAGFASTIHHSAIRPPSIRSR